MELSANRKRGFAQIPAVHTGESAPKGFKGLTPGGSARLLNACTVTVRDVVKDAASGEVVELRCTIGNEGAAHTKGLDAVAWVPSTALAAEVRLYDDLFLNCTVETPNEDGSKPDTPADMASESDLVTDQSEAGVSEETSLATTNQKRGFLLRFHLSADHRHGREGGRRRRRGAERARHDAWNLSPTFVSTNQKPAFQ